MKFKQLLHAILGLPLPSHVIAPPPDSERERLGLSEEAVQLVYLDGLGWVYQVRRPDQHKSIDALIEAARQQENEHGTQGPADPAAH
jgi:hypothetical protein